MASYGARVRGSVFKMKFWVLSREFESIETSPGFAQLLGENWVSSHKKSIFKTMLEKICVKGQKSRSECCDFTKKFKLHNFWQEKMTGNGMNKNPKNWQCALVTHANMRRG